MAGCSINRAGVHLNPAGHLGVGSAQVVRPDLVRDTRWQPACEPAVIRGRDPVQLRIVVWNERSRALENRSECYRSVPDRQRGRAERRHQLGQHLGSERPREQQRGLELLDLAHPPARREHLAAAGVEHREHDVEPARPLRVRVRKGQRRAAKRPRQRQRVQGRDTNEWNVPGPRQRPRGRDPDPQPGEGAGSDANGDPVDAVPPDRGGLEYRRRERQQPRRVSGALARARIVPGRVDDLADAGKRNGGRRRRGVEREDSHVASIVTTRRSPPACSITTRAATRESPAIVAVAFSGHSTNAIRSGAM